jgi:phytoene desaturase
MQANGSKAVVIGAGIAGMATAIRLAVAGWEVEVFERNNYPGGKLSWFSQDGFSFDAGPSLFTQPQHLEELFALSGEPIQPYFKYHRAAESCRYFFHNGKRVTAWADLERFAIELQDQLGENPESLHRYLSRSQKVYQKIGTLFLQQSLHRPGSFRFKPVREALAHTAPGLLFQSLHQHNASAFKTREAAQIFDRYATYNGSNPYAAPAMLSLIPHLEMNEGTFYPEGGMISITKALHALASRLGVQFHFATPVQRIVAHEGRVKGVVVNHENISADAVVSNCDVYFTYLRLLKDEARAARVLKHERSSSALIFYWGIGRSFEQLGLHNILFTENYQAEFNHLFRKRSMYSDPTVYINITSKMEAGHAPQGMENWFVMVNAPANNGQPWQDWIPTIRAQVLEKISHLLGEPIEPFILTEATLDPTTIESRTTSYMGSLYGTSSNSKWAAFLRHPNFSSTFKGLYFVGGSVHPGGGIPLCLRSAAIAASLMEQDKKTYLHK